LAGIRANYNVTWTLGNDYADGKMDVIEAYESYLIKDVDKVYAEAITVETLSSRINQFLGV